MASPFAFDSSDPVATLAHSQAAFARMGWAASAPLLKRLFDDATRMFRGGFPGYQAGDMRYHDLEHTLQAAACLIGIIEGRKRDNAQPAFSRRDAELSVMAALLHDGGFLKRTDDRTGTGAKYTFVHERRSCDLARAYLPALPVTPDEVEDVCAAIGCTGPRNRISAQPFRRLEAHLMADCLVTADYLAQMSAPDYPDKLGALYEEFVEAFEFEGVPPDKRPYQSHAQLLAKTPDFWTKFVLPMLETDADGVYRHLSITGQPNPYLQAVEANIAEIRRRLQQGLVRA